MEEVKFIRDKYEFTSGSSIMLMNNRNDNSRVDLITLLMHDLSLYGILMRDLVNYPLKEKERNLCLNIAYYIIENRDFQDVLLEKRILNIKKLSRATRIKSDYIKKWKDYIISYWIILNNPDYKFIQDYLKIKLNEKLENRIHDKKNEKLYSGIVLKLLMHNTAYILTSIGEFKKVRLSSDTGVGSICNGKKRYSKNIIKIPFCIFLLISIIISIKIYSKYKTTSSIIVIETTSNIKLHTNTFNRVIYAYSPTDKGKTLISSIEMNNKKVDDVIDEIMEYGFKNKMISQENKLYITVTGQKLIYGELVKTSKFSAENDITVVINNGGVEQNLLLEEKKEETKQTTDNKNEKTKEEKKDASN